MAALQRRALTIRPGRQACRARVPLALSRPAVLRAGVGCSSYVIRSAWSRSWSEAVTRSPRKRKSGSISPRQLSSRKRVCAEHEPSSSESD